MSKHLASEWLDVVEHLESIKEYRYRAIARALADAYRQGWSASRNEEGEEDSSAAILLRTLAAEAERTGSWTVPLDLQERIAAWVTERDIGGKR